MLGLLSGELTRNYNYSEFGDSIRTLEDHRYRFCYYPFEGYTELYDRLEDPRELNNLSGNGDYCSVENRMLKAIIDFGIMAKGPRIEAQDMVPSKRKGLETMHPHFLEDFPIVFPLPNMAKYKRLEEAGLDPEYNSFCKGRKILASYGRYWEDKS